MSVFLGCTSTGLVGLCFLWFYVQELPKAQPAVVLVLKRLQRLKVSSDRLGEAGNRTCDPWFTRHRFIPYTTAANHMNPLGSYDQINSEVHLNIMQQILKADDILTLSSIIFDAFEISCI